MELHVYYTKELPRRHAVTLDRSGENLTEIEPPGVWFYWKTVTSLPGVSGYDALSARADLEAQGWALLDYEKDGAPFKASSSRDADPPVVARN
jgi:hypothetical protein